MIYGNQRWHGRGRPRKNRPMRWYVVVAFPVTTGPIYMRREYRRLYDGKLDQANGTLELENACIFTSLANAIRRADGLRGFKIHAVRFDPRPRVAELVWPNPSVADVLAALA